MPSAIRHVRVVGAALDALHATRLKLACSLLLAERIDAALVLWDGETGQLPGGDLLVAGDSVAPAAVAAFAREHRAPALTIRRDAPDGAPGLIRHGATVRDMHMALRAALGETEPVKSPMFEAVLANDRPAHLLRGSLAISFAPEAGAVYVPAGFTARRLVEAMGEPGWQAAATLPPSHSDSPRACISREALIFAAAFLHPDWMPVQAQSDRPMQLSQWPELEDASTSPAWLFTVGLLHARPWRAGTLGSACRLPPALIDSLLSAAMASGLARFEEVSMPSSPPPKRSATQNRFFAWVSRRFGIDTGRGGA